MCVCEQNSKRLWSIMKNDFNMCTKYILQGNIQGGPGQHSASAFFSHIVYISEKIW